MSRLAGAALALSLLAPAPVGAAVRGISDDNLPLMTAAGRAALARADFAHARMVISMGTPASDPQVRAWMREAHAQRYTVMISARLPAGAAVPSSRAYSAWLRGILRAYPQISAVEATNEPELTRIPVSDAARLYRAARTAARGRLVLAGGFSDKPGREAYVRSYARRVSAPVWALHAYRAVVDNQLRRTRTYIRAVGAKSVWITETAAFVALGRQTFSPSQQRAQAARVLRLSRLPQVRRTYWQGWEACRGCQPTVSAPAPAGGRPSRPGPVLPYHQPVSPIVWHSYPLVSGPNGTATNPALLSAIQPAGA